MQPDLTHQVHKIVQTHCRNASVFLIGVSGGVDSMTLVHCFLQSFKDANQQVAIAHINHGLRAEESDQDEAFVEAYAQHNNIPFFTEKFNVLQLAHQTGQGIEATARNCRYEFFRKVSNEFNVSTLLLAHNANDLAETVLMHLARGSGVRGLAGFPLVKPLAGTNTLVVRPFRSIKRADIVDFAKKESIPWREDSSNSDENYLRNSVRKVLIPALGEVFSPNVVDKIVQSADLLSNASGIVDSAADNAIANILHHDDSGVSILLGPIRTVDMALQSEVIRRALFGYHRAVLVRKGARHSHPEQPSFVDTARVKSLIDSNIGSRVSLANNVIAIRDRMAIQIPFSVDDNSNPEVVYLNVGGKYMAFGKALLSAQFDKADVRIDANPQFAYVDADQVVGPVRWRIWQDADKFVPLGMNGHVLVSDFLTNSKVAHVTRRRITVLSDDNGIIWVCGMRIAEHVRVTLDTKRIIEFKIEDV